MAAISRLTKHRLAGFNHGCLVEAEKWILVEPGQGDDVTGPAVYLVNVPAHAALPIWETTELNPLIPSPVAVVVAILLGGLAVLTAVALVVFLALRLTASPRGSDSVGDER